MHRHDLLNNRAGENRPGEVRPSPFVYSFVSSVKFAAGARVSTFVGTYAGIDTQREATFVSAFVFVFMTTPMSTLAGAVAFLGHIPFSPAPCASLIYVSLR